MNKRMEPITVRTSEGKIFIEQDNEDQGIIIEADQVPLLVEWLKEAAAALEAERRGE